MLRRLSLSILSLPLLAALSLPARAADTEYLFDLTEDEIVRLMDEYVGERGYDPEQVLARMTAPFDCRHHEAMCAEIGGEYSYYLLEHVWTQGRRGADVKVISAEVEALLPKLSASWVEMHFPDGIDLRDIYFGVPAEPSGSECFQNVVYKESGVFRLRQAVQKMDGILVMLPYSHASFFKKNNNGKFKAEKANVLRVDARYFVTLTENTGFETQMVFEEAKQKSNERRITVTFFGADLPNAISDVHVEGCGKATDAVVLEACACTGERPAIYEGL